MFSRRKIRRLHSLKSKYFNQAKRILMSRGALISMLVVFLVSGGSVLAMPITYEGTETSRMPFGTEYKNESVIELGTEQVAQEGKDGLLSTRYKYAQSRFNRLFNKDDIDREVLDSDVVTKPTSKIMLKGTRKWQYMMCSNGTYRYYTDEQFKDPNTGFTSKSPDGCAQNKQGTRVKLADSLSGGNVAARPTYVPPKCTLVDIPYKTVYKDVDWLYVGQTQDGYGVNGFKYICTGGSYASSINPTDKIVYRGTKLRETTTYTPAPVVSGPDYAANYKCDSEYSSAKAQIIRAGAENSSAMQQLEYAYSRCLRSAGF